MRIDMSSEFTIIFVAPFYNRSGYGMGARGLVRSLGALGVSIKIVPVDGVEPGIDDADLEFLKSLETTPVSGIAVLICYHVPGEWMLNIKLPPKSIRIIFTTFDGANQGGAVPLTWVEVCNQMDLVFVPASEFDAWRKQGLKSDILRDLVVPHSWLSLGGSVKELGKQTVFRFLSVAMFQPRRRWDVLIKAFFEEFANEPNVELYLKVNYPSWHPVPGTPKSDLESLINFEVVDGGSAAKVTIDDCLGTRIELMRLIDSANCCVSLDAAPTAPTWESLLRGKLIVIPESIAAMYPSEAAIRVTEGDSVYLPISLETLGYQPYHRGQMIQHLSVASVRRSLRIAFENEHARLRRPWSGWGKFMDVEIQNGDGWYGYLLREVAEAIGKRESDKRLKVVWEGSQFVYHSLAHVNRQLCVLLVGEKSINLGIVPYERDQFDPRDVMPKMTPLLNASKKIFPVADIHVRHQWPPSFVPPSSGVWVMVQPWEFGGIPLDWVRPMRESVDEIWVPSTWVRDCYIKSGIPSGKVQVIPNGVDLDVFKPDGPSFILSSSKSFRFLFVGGTIYRKGIDIVLSAYCKAFRKTDDVVLVIKGQSGATYKGTEIGRLLDKLRDEDPDMPEIEYMTAPLTEAEMAALYRSCDALVHPYRGEGFGLPIVEAMASGLPVIVTARGASADFVRSEFSIGIPSVRRETSVDNLVPTAPGFWLEEPDEGAVVNAMRELYLNPAGRVTKGLAARAYAVAHMSWTHSLEKVLERLNSLQFRVPCRLNTVKSALVFRVDWATVEWKEVLLSYVDEFKSEEPVSLVLTLEGESCRLSVEEAIQAVASALKNHTFNQFPEIQVISKMEEALRIAERCSVQWLSNDPYCLDGVVDQFGHRLAAARIRRVEGNLRGVEGRHDG